MCRKVFFLKCCQAIHFNLFCQKKTKKDFRYYPSRKALQFNSAPDSKIQNSKIKNHQSLIFSLVLTVISSFVTLTQEASLQTRAYNLKQNEPETFPNFNNQKSLIFSLIPIVISTFVTLKHEASLQTRTCNLKQKKPETKKT